MADQSLETRDLPVARILDDASFNCRGQITPYSVADLARSIQDHGLQFAISVQPIANAGYAEIPINPQDDLPYEYRTVAGHRRLMAFRILKRDTIPCTIRPDLDEKKARILNLIENFQRENLNILQEALALKHLMEAGVPRETVAKEIGMSGGWVQNRFYLLQLPEEIQQEAAAGLISQFQIKQLYSLGNKELQFEAVKKLKDAKAKGETAPFVGKRKPKSVTIKKERKRDEIFQMIDLLAESIGYGLHTRSLAWASGEISTYDLLVDVQKENPEFVIPTEL